MQHLSGLLVFFIWQNLTTLSLSSLAPFVKPGGMKDLLNIKFIMGVIEGPLLARYALTVPLTLSTSEPYRHHAPRQAAPAEHSHHTSLIEPNHQALDFAPFLVAYEPAPLILPITLIFAYFNNFLALLIASPSRHNANSQANTRPHSTEAYFYLIL